MTVLNLVSYPILITLITLTADFLPESSKMETWSDYPEWVHDQNEPPISSDRVTAYRFRSDFFVELDEDEGWAGEVNGSHLQSVDTPFRLRFELESSPGNKRRQYSLQYKYNEGPWMYAEAQEFPYPSEASPVLSIVGCPAYFYGEEAGDLLSVSKLPAESGAGITLAPTTSGWIPESSEGASAEWEWALVLRYWSDGPMQLKEGDRFTLRMVSQDGLPLSGPEPEISIHIPDAHIGGTFVETPSRVGPYENSQGELYFIMEPTETDNVFMMIKSSDGGNTWVEMDPGNRPQTDDLEGVGSLLSEDGVIHMIHETSNHAIYHAFATADHPDHPDQWIVRDQIITGIEKPQVQTADIVLRPDGSLVALYASGDGLQFSIMEKRGDWGNPIAVSHPAGFGLTNPNLLCRPDGIIEMVYKSKDGKGWSRQLFADNSLSDPIPFADELGSREGESMAILPLVWMAESKNLAVVYRQEDGFLFALFKEENNAWSEPVRVSDRAVVSNAVDSDQAGGDAIGYGDKLYIPFIAEDNREIYLSVLKKGQVFPKIQRMVPGIDGAWVRGNILKKQSSPSSLGIIYDAGSKGGSGFNRYLEYPIF